MGFKPQRRGNIPASKTGAKRCLEEEVLTSGPHDVCHAITLSSDTFCKMYHILGMFSLEKKKWGLNLNLLCNLSPDIGSKTAFDRWDKTQHAQSGDPGAKVMLKGHDAALTKKTDMGSIPRHSCRTNAKQELFKLNIPLRALKRRKMHWRTMTSFYWNNTNFEWKKYQLWDGEKVTRLYNNNGNKHPFPRVAYTDDLLYVFCLLPLKVQESSNITNLVEKANQQ